MSELLSSQILGDLPNVPLEVVQTWLVPHAQRDGFGWPPGPGDPWQQILMGRSLAWWHACTWHEEQLPMHLDYMAQVAQFQVKRLIKSADQDRDLLPDSRQRISRLVAAIQDTGTWPIAPVGFPDTDGLGLADGYHRLAALTILRRTGQIATDTRHRVWIAINST